VAPAASEFVGVNVATVFPLLKLTDPATGLLLASTTVNDTVPGCTACENVTDGATDTGFPDDPELGVTDATCGGVTGWVVSKTTSTA
jgi:Na+/glutamate symporter